MQKKVFLSEDLHHEAYELLAKNFQIINDFNNIQEVEAIITRNLKIDKAVIDDCMNLKVVAIHGTGYDHVDVKYLKQKGISVFHVPGENALSVAELVVGCILNLSRNLYEADRLFHQGTTLKPGTGQLMGMEISHKVRIKIGERDYVEMDGASITSRFEPRIFRQMRSDPCVLRFRAKARPIPEPERKFYSNQKSAYRR